MRRPVNSTRMARAVEHRRGAGRDRRLAAGGRRRDQPSGVSVSRRRQYFAARAALDAQALVHDVNAVGDAPDEAEIVRDEDDRQAKSLLQLPEQCQDAGLHRDIERGRRLVRDQQIGIERQCHRDHHPLALAARQLVRIGVELGGRVIDGDQLEQLERPVAGGGPRHSGMAPQRRRHLLADAVERVERRHRLLEDHGHSGAAKTIELSRRGAEQLRAAIARRSGRDAVGGEQAHDRQHRLALARAELADDGDRLAGGDVEVQAAHRVDRAASTVEPHRELANRQQWLGRRRHRIRRCRSGGSCRARRQPARGTAAGRPAARRQASRHHAPRRSRP